MERLERFVSGAGGYVDDIKVHKPLYMAVVRSPYAHARITSVKGDCLSAKDIDAVLTSVGEGSSQGREAHMHPVFAKEYANYVGQPVAAVFTEDPYSAEDLRDGIEVEYEPLEVVSDPEAALSAPPIHKSMKSNILSDKYLGKRFNIDADVVLEDRLENKRIATNAIEPRGILVEYGGGRAIVHISTQSVFSAKRGICGTLGIAEDKIEVIQADTGGAFGLKGGLQSEYPIAVYAAMKYKRPVKWIETRTEHLMAANQGRGAIGKMKLYANKHGRILGIEGEIIVDAGAYAGGIAEFSPRFIASQITEQYAIENGFMHAMSVLTNKVPYGPYRGAGRPEAAFFMERMVDMLADELHMDDAEIRLINAADKPFKSPLGLEIEASKPFMLDALKALKYEKYKKKKAGLGFFVLIPAVAPGESAKIQVKDGMVHVWLGSNPHGQGHEFFVKKLVHEELGVPKERVMLEVPDTDKIRAGVGTWGSRSAIVGGAALVNVARQIKEQVIAKEGKYTAKALLSGSYEYFKFYQFAENVNSFGANLATVSIKGIGNISVDDVYTYYDVGRALDMNMIKGQITGGVLQGVGQALSEEVYYDSNGQLLTSSISNAGLLHANNIPNMHINITEKPSQMPHHAKGLGEAPTIGTPVAVVRAIEKVSGRRIRSTPVKQEDII